MRLDLRDVVNTPEARKPFQFQLDLSEIELYGRRPIANPVLVEGCVTNHAGALVLEGTARSTLELACDRCGREFSREKIVRLESLVAQQLEQCGLKISITQRTGEKYAADLKYGRFDLYLGEIRLSPNFDLTPFFASDGAVGAYGGMASGTLYQQNLAALENSGNYYELYKALMDDGRLCPLLFRTYAVYATRGVAANLLPGLDNVFHTANNRQLADAKE